MFKIDKDTIEVTRGDKLPLTLSIPINETENYLFRVGDKITFGVYKKRNYKGSALILKEFIIEHETEIVDISLTGEETKIGDFIEKPTDYWYEIQLNDDETIIGADDDGNKIFRLYPEGSNEKQVEETVENE